MQKITGTTALSWLGLEDSDDPNDEDSNRFEIKKQFEGSKGEEVEELNCKFVARNCRFLWTLAPISV